MAELPECPLNIAMFSPWHERCGIRDYTAHLAAAMDALPSIGSTRIVSAPRGAARASIFNVLKNHRADAKQFGALGRAMNVATDIAHVQHQYFLFGGVAPYRTHITSFFDAIEVPIVLTVHEIAQAPTGWLKQAVVRTANRINFAHPKIKAWIVHTEVDKSRLLQMGIAERSVHVIRHPMPPALPMPDTETARQTLEAEYPGLAQRRIITIFGFLSNKKGHRVALAALSRMPEDIALIFAGDQHPDDYTDYVPSLKAEIDRLVLADRVIITGYLTEERIAEIMAVTDVALAPFLHTSGSGSLANLMAYGRATIASDIEPHREILAAEPGVFALVPLGDPEALASAAISLLNDPSKRERLQSAGLAYAARRSYGEMARETLSIYHNVLDSR